MIEEAYVSYKTAALLKEKGFDEYCLKSYFKMNKSLKDSGFSDWEKANELKAPTQQMAMRWLREVHNLYLVFKPLYFNGEDYTYWLYENFKGEILFFKSYEEAVEAAIKYCLENLI